jgi:hypothetical protein
MQALKVTIPIRDSCSGILTPHASLHLFNNAVGDGTFPDPAALKRFKEYLRRHLPFSLPTSAVVGEPVLWRDLREAVGDEVCCSPQCCAARSSPPAENTVMF